jgi:tetratricopeptide (TPR) repeat protein
MPWNDDWTRQCQGDLTLLQGAIVAENPRPVLPPRRRRRGRAFAWLWVVGLAGCAAVTDSARQAPAALEAPSSSLSMPRAEAVVEGPALPARPMAPALMLALMSAERQLLSGDLDGALGAYLALLAEEASDPALLQRALTLAGYGDDPALEFTLAQALLRDRPDPLSRLAFARALGRSGNFGGVLDTLAPLAALAGPVLFDRFVDGVLLAEVDEAERARLAQRLAQRAFVAETPRSLARGLARAAVRIYLAQRLYEDALILMADAGLTMLASPTEVGWRAEALEGTGQLAAALGHLEEGLEKFPDAGGLRFARARLQVRLNDLDAARDDFLSLLQRSGEQADLLLALALIHLDQDLLDEASTYLDRLDALGQRPAQVAFHRGEVAAREGRLAAALELWATLPPGRDQGRMLRRAAFWLQRQNDPTLLDRFLVAQGTRYPEALERTALSLADALLAEAGPAAAERVLTHALAARPTPSLYYRRALLAEARGQGGAAEADLRAVLALAPAHAQAMNALGFFLAERGERLDEAQALVEQALRLAPDTPAFLDSLGWVAFKRGDLEGALEPLRQAYQRRGDGEIAAHLGEVYWRLGRRNRARQAWLAGLEGDPEDPTLVETVRRLLGDRGLTVMRRQLGRGLGGV